MVILILGLQRGLKSYWSASPSGITEYSPKSPFSFNCFSVQVHLWLQEMKMNVSEKGGSVVF